MKEGVNMKSKVRFQLTKLSQIVEEGRTEEFIQELSKLRNMDRLCYDKVISARKEARGRGDRSGKN